MTSEACITALPFCPRSTANAPASTEVTISVAEVMLGTSAALSVPRRRFGMVHRLRTLLGGRHCRRSFPPRRGDYLEAAAMAREMHRL